MLSPKCSFKIIKKLGVVISKNKRFPCSGIIYIAWTIFLVTWDVNTCLYAHMYSFCQYSISPDRMNH